MPKIYRVLVYEGPEDWLKRTLSGGGVPMNGQTHQYHGEIGVIRSYVTSYHGDIKCITCEKEPAQNIHLMCDMCYAKLETESDKAEAREKLLERTKQDGGTE